VLRALDEVAEFVGICIAGAVSLVNPRRVVLAGTLGTLSPWLLAGARRLVAQRTRSPTVVEIVGSQLGDEAAIRGALRSSCTTCCTIPCVPAGALAHNGLPAASPPD
jgi:predicted NBD/HSP70 family sugar kinase